MDRDEALRLLKGGPEGVAEWNRRREAGEEIPDLREARLDWASLDWARLNRARLVGASLAGASLDRASLVGASLDWARLDRASLVGARLVGARLVGASLDWASLDWASLDRARLVGARLAGASLAGANLAGVDLAGANLAGARCWGTIFADVDLSGVKGLDQIQHDGPSTIGIDTLFRSRGEISEAFLRGCGVPESVIVNRFALVGALEPIQFHSCFISHSTKDKEFAKRLHARMVQEKLRVWFAPEDMKAGHYHDEQIEHAIQVHDKLLLVLSEASMASEWVRREIRKARETEAREDRRKLFPIRLVGMEMVQEWQCVDPRTGQDYAEEVLKYHIPDFSNWKDHDAFEASFARLLRDLKAEDSTAK